MVLNTFIAPESCTIGALENKFDAWYRANSNNNDILLDLSLVEYTEVASMIYLISMIDGILKSGKNLRISIPKSDVKRNDRDYTIGREIREILRLWKFPQSLKKVTGYSFSQLVLMEDHHYFGESDNSNKILNNLSQRDEGLANLIKKDYLSITHFPFSSNILKEISIDDECNRWNESIVKGILKKYLNNCIRENENMIPARIVWECMSNAAKHSEANHLLTGAFFDKKGDLFTLVYWDDGKSIINTLKSELDLGNEIYSDISVYDDIPFTFGIKSEIKEIDTGKVINSKSIPNKEAPLIEILLSSFFPGVTRSPFGGGNLSTNPYLNYKTPGMGLPTLLNAAVLELGGRIAVRTMNYFINITKAKNSFIKTLKVKTYPENTIYKAKLIEYRNIPEFRGNMITIRIPITK